MTRKKEPAIDYLVKLNTINHVLIWYSFVGTDTFFVLGFLKLSFTTKTDTSIFF